MAISSRMEVEFVGGPRCGERRTIDGPVQVVRFKVRASRGAKPGKVMLYQRRSSRRKLRGVLYYDYVGLEPAKA